MTPTDPCADRVEAVVLEHLERMLSISRPAIARSADRTRDLEADGDDSSFLCIPGLETELGVRVDHATWRTVYTVQDAIDALREACTRQRGLA